MRKYMKLFLNELFLFCRTYPVIATLLFICGWFIGLFMRDWYGGYIGLMV